MDLARLLTAYRLQAGGCRWLGSELYAELMDAARSDVEAGGPLLRLVEDWPGDPLASFLPLRVFGAVHARVLAGEAPELARHYPTAGGVADARAAWPAFRSFVAARLESLRPQLIGFPQTNEVRRCGGLLGGFLEAARATGLPLRLREIGCSAGLNLQWHRFRYELGPHRWGDPRSPARVEADWSGPPAPFGVSPRVESRAGCDLDPRRVESDDDVRVLEGYVWADQPERLALLRAAVRVWREDPPRIDAARALEWLPAELDADGRGSCLVVFHSSVWMYLPDAERVALRQALERRGARAGTDDPLAWLRAEDEPERPGQIEVKLTVWPGGRERRLARGHPHGRSVEWLAP
jgi:hypothetical protein